MISLLLAIAFLIISHPLTYIYSNRLLARINVRTSFDNAPGLPTVTGLLVHSGVMFLVSAFLMYRKGPQVTRIKIDKYPDSPKTKTILVDK